MDTVTIPPTRNGPPDSGHGGYSAGLFAGTLAQAGPIQVRLHRPPPLGVPLTANRAGASIGIEYADELVAEVTQKDATFAGIPESPSPAAAAAAAEQSAFRLRSVAHPFPTCFGCGTLRPPGDGLQIWPGLTADGGTAAALWDPQPWLNSDGVLPNEMQWAALDCPGALGAMEQLGLALGEETWLLGTMTAQVPSQWSPDGRVIVLGWLQSRQGRKHLVGSALLSAEGVVQARAEAIWIQVGSGAF